MRTIRSVTLAIAATLLATQAHATGVAVKTGGAAARVHTEEALIHRNPSNGLEYLLMRAEFADAGDLTYWVIQTPSQPAATRWTGDARAFVASLGAGKKPENDLNTTVAKSVVAFKNDDEKLNAFLAKEKIDVPDMDAWKKRLPKDGWLTFVPVERSKERIEARVRLVFKTPTPFYPFSTPSTGKLAPSVRLDYVGLRPAAWLEGGAQPAKGNVPRPRAYLPKHEHNVAGATLQQLSDAQRAAIGVTDPPPRWWIARYEVAESAGVRRHDAELAPSSSGKETIKLQGPPFASGRSLAARLAASGTVATPTPSSSGSVTGPKMVKEALPTLRSRPRRGGRKATVQAMAVVGILGLLGYGGYTWYSKRKDRT